VIAGGTALGGVDAGSFRDPDGRVVVGAGGVHRLLGPQGREDWRALAASPLWRALQDEGVVVATEEVEADEVPDVLPSGVAGVLRHERVPFVSYPYEWPFSMLKDAALLQLRLNRRALAAGFTLKDATPYNVQWRGATPVFIDVGSFERLRPGEPWAGYRQFCMLYLYPLMLQAYRGLPYHAALRGSLEGITPDAARTVLATPGARLRKGVLSNVVLHARLEARYAAADGRSVRQELRRAGFGEQVLDATLGKLETLVAGLEWRPGETAWTAYGRGAYDAEAAARKEGFVREAAARRRAGRVWDVGCNDGTYARIAAESADHVIALDADHATVEALYLRLRDEGREDILPLVMDVTDPSPDRGWRGRERASLERRGTPDLALFLAVVHHLCIAGNVPVRELVDWMRGLDARIVVEVPDREDPMAQRLLGGKREGANPDYDGATFEQALAERFRIERAERVATRTLYELSPQA
jgi:SAM-dependent methyltransferase